MLIDTHMHLVRPFDSHGRPQIYSPGNPTSAADYVALMDEAGIDRAFLISWSPEDIPADLMAKGIPAEAVRQTLSRDYALEVMEEYPDRFYWFPCHLGPGGGDPVRMARDNLEQGAAGLKLVCSFWGELPDDERLRPLYGLAAEHGAQIILDTSFWYLGKDDRADPASLLPGFREVAQRVDSFQQYSEHLGRAVSAHPGVHFQLAHAGARTFTVSHAREVGQFVAQHPNAFVDLAALPMDGPALESLIEAAGADRVMFGTDWPHFCQGDAMREALDQIRRPGRFSEKAAGMILGGNALRFVRGRGPGLK